MFLAEEFGDWAPWREKASSEDKEQWNAQAEGFCRWAARSIH